MKLKRQTMYVVALMVLSSDAGSTPAISTTKALGSVRELSCFWDVITLIVTKKLAIYRL